MNDRHPNRKKHMSDRPDVECSFEEKLESIDSEIKAVLKGIQLMTSTMRRAVRASASGALRELQGAISDLNTQLNSLELQAKDLMIHSDYDLRSWMDSGEYARELISISSQSQLAMIESDGKLLCYPSVIQVFPADQSVTIDKKRDKNIRPSVIVEHLKVKGQAKVKFKPDAFIESLATAYKLFISSSGRRKESHVKLAELYDILTLLPGSRAYSKQEFARDVYLLDQSGIVTVKDGRTLRFAASATTRSSSKGYFETVAKGGQVKIYSTISFEAIQ